MGRPLKDLHRQASGVVDPSGGSNDGTKPSLNDLLLGQNEAPFEPPAITTRRSLLSGRLRRSPVSILQAEGKGFLHQHGLPLFEGLKNRQCMLMLGRRNDDRIHSGWK